MGFKIAMKEVSMKSLTLKPSLLVYALFLWVFTALVCPKVAVATETDSYTYSYIDLEDSAEKLNQVTNQLLKEVVSQVNAEVLRNKKNTGKTSTDTDIEFYFSHYFAKLMFQGTVADNVFSQFETCIDSNSCSGWPYFERIALLPSESIYFEADYSMITKKYVASNIKACGVRFSTDKISHFFKDGFRYYNGSKDSGYASTEKQVERYSILFEQYEMGGLATGVYSKADIYANLQGYRFFNNILSKYLIKNRDGTVQIKDIDLCDYIDSKFDERLNTNVYTKKDKLEALNKAKNKRRSPSPTDPSREEILARKHHPGQLTPLERLLMNTYISLLGTGSGEMKTARQIMFTLPVLRQSRLPSRIQNDGRILPIYLDNF